MRERRGWLGLVWIVLGACVCVAGSCRAAAGDETGMVTRAWDAVPSGYYQRGFPPFPAVEDEDLLVSNALERVGSADLMTMMNFLSEEFPDVLSDFRRRAVKSREQAVRFLSGMARGFLDLMEMKRKDPARYAKIVRQKRLEREAEELSSGLKGGGGGKERDKQVAELRKVLAESFGLKQELMSADLDDMEARVREIRELIKKRQESRDLIVERRLRELIEGPDPLKW